jgi:phosphatidylserine decarboxylase
MFENVRVAPGQIKTGSVPVLHVAAITVRRIGCNNQSTDGISLLA